MLHGRWFLLSVGKTGGGQTLESKQVSSGTNLVRHGGTDDWDGEKGQTGSKIDRTW